MFIRRMVVTVSACALTFASVHAAPFTEGNLVVVRVGGDLDDLQNFPDSAARVRLLEINPADGSIVQTVRLPATPADIPLGSNNHLLTLNTDFRAGQIHRSVNGLYLTMGGYDAKAKDAVSAGYPIVNQSEGNTPLVIGADSFPPVPRVVARIDQTGTVDTITAISLVTDQSNGPYGGGEKASFRSVFSVDGSAFWLAGRTDGTSSTTSRRARIQYAVYGATVSNQVPNGSQFVDCRAVGIYYGRRTDGSGDYTPALQLYGTFHNLSPNGMYSLGVGTPNSNGTTTTRLHNPNGTDGGGLVPSPYDFFFADENTIYLCNDDPPSAGNTIGFGAGIEKWVWDDTLATPAYTYRYTLNANLDLSLQTVRTLTGRKLENGNVELYAITATNQTTGNTERANHLVKVTDTGCPTGTEVGCSAADAFAILTTAGDLEAFRGVAFTPRPCVGAECLGACCMPVHTCVPDQTFQACTTAGGVFRGEQTSCSTSVCGLACHNPFADADGDGDVDMNDFAEFQKCFSGSGHPLTGDCKCFDRPEEGFPDGDNDVDQTDFNSFVNCATRANVAADPNCDG
jgi:hypothetical protein